MPTSPSIPFPLTSARRQIFHVPFGRLDERNAIVDLVLVMSVFPGFGGQKFMPEVLTKVRWLRERGFERDIEMDGGLNEKTLPLCAQAGTNVFVAGSAIFRSSDMGATIRSFRANAQREHSALMSAHVR